MVWVKHDLNPIIGLIAHNPTELQICHYLNSEFLKFINFHALEPKFLGQVGSYFGIRPSIHVLKGWYDKPALKSTQKCDLGGKCDPPPQY